MRQTFSKYSYDEKCFELAQHFYPTQSFAFLEALAQEFQDCVEGREDVMPTSETAVALPEMIWEPCTKGGIWRCKSCGDAYASPPWNSTSAAMDHGSQCTQQNR